MPGLGSLSKSAFKIEGGAKTGTGLVNSTYPQQPDTTSPHADEEEVFLKSSDLIPFLSESVEEEHTFESDETLIGTPAVSNMDRVGLIGGGSIECQGMYDALDALIACAMGFENPEATDSPTYQNATALTAGGGIGAGTWVDSGTPFASTDVGKFIRVTNGTGEGQVRRISGYTNSSTVSITPNWGTTPSAGNTGSMADEFLHLYELAPRLADELFADLDDNQGFTYPTGGIGTATDQIIRRGTLGFLKQSTTPWIWRSCMINGMGISVDAGGSMKFTFDIIPFDLDRSSSTNGASSADNWDWDHAKPSTVANSNFQTNELILFNHLTGSGFWRVDTFANGAMTSADEYGFNSFNLQLNNNLKVDDQDALTGEYRVEPGRGGFREVTGSFSLPRYSAETFIDWAANETVLQMHLKFVGSTLVSSARSFEIFLSSMQITKPSAPVGGADVIQQTFEFRALIPTEEPTFISSGNPTQIITSPRSEMMIRILNQNPFNQFRDQNQEY